MAEVAEIEYILKGNILFIGSKEFYTLLVIALIVISIFVIFQKQFKFVLFDPESAESHGMNSKFWLLLFYLVVGIGISLITRFVGDVFTFAFLLIPPSIGIMLGKSVNKVFIILIVAGAIIPPISLLLAFKMDFSSGPKDVAIAFTTFIFVLIYKKVKGTP